MKSSSPLTYLLFGLLALFILVAGYYACEKQKEKKAQAAREQVEVDETLDNLGYGPNDSTNTGSSYINKDSLEKSPSKTKPKVSNTGIEDETSSNVKTVAPTSKTKPSTTIAKPGTSKTKKGVSAVRGPGTGRWAVRAGTFEYKDGARRRLEEVIKAGFPNAEISKTKEGKAAVVVFRSNDKDAAYRVVDQLQGKGIDAAVFDRSN